jgi:hypothetical protein
MTVDEAEREPGRDADPEVGRERQRLAEQPRLEADLEGEVRLELAALEHQRAGHEVGRLGTRGRAGQHRDREHHASHGGTVSRLIAIALLAAGCQHDLGDVDGIFYDGDGRKVHCGADLDTKANNSLDSVDTALDRAVDRGEVVELYAHNPGKTVPVSTIEHVLAGARDRGLPFVTYADFAAGGGTGPGIALSFDDTFIAAWSELRPMFTAYHARVTFFVSRYGALAPELHDQLHQLAADGHEIAAHTVLHLRGPDYVEQHGVAAYLRDEVLPSIQILRDEGFEVTSFAYPFGARTDETDDAILAHVPIIRSVAFSYYGSVQSPCPH